MEISRMNLELINIRGGMTEELTKAPMTTKKPIFDCSLPSLYEFKMFLKLWFKLYIAFWFRPL